MSLHVQMSPEAAATLAAQRRNSPIASIVVGILSMFLLALVFWLIGIAVFSDKTEPMIAFNPEQMEEEEVVQEKVTTEVKKTPAAPSSAVSPVIAVSTPTDFSVPTPDVVLDLDTPDFGSSDAFGDGSGSGSGGGSGFGGGSFAALPNDMKKRCSPQERLQRLKETGGNEACEEAVVKGLRWLKKTQNNDGSWSSNHQGGMTGLAILAYLGHCDTPLSPEFGETVEDGIIYLIGLSNKNNGSLATDLQGHAYVYEHCIAAYALAEAYTFCNIIGYKIEGLENAVRRATDRIISGQSASGMWNYPMDPAKSANDLSTSAWAMQALKAAKSTGLGISRIHEAAKKELEGIAKNQAASGAYGYRGPNSHGGVFTLTGAGVLCFQQWRKGKTRNATAGVDWISKNAKFQWGTESGEIYGHYYKGQAMMEAGGQAWANYNALFRDQALKGQAADGSFTPPGGKAPGNLYNSDQHYRTCLSILMLEVYYRFLPGTSKR